MRHFDCAGHLAVIGADYVENVVLQVFPWLQNLSVDTS
jgi:hypothetical protein